MQSEYFIHQQAVCDSTQIGFGTRIWGFTHVLKNAEIGRDCNIGEHVFIENQVKVGNGCTIKNGVALWDLITLEEDVFVGPYVVFTNDMKPRSFIRRGIDSFLPTLIKRGATLGANSTIVCGVTIGQYAMVGAGTVVTKSVPDHALVVGNPGRIIYRICYCGEKLDSKDFCLLCNKVLKDNTVDLVKVKFSHSTAST